MMLTLGQMDSSINSTCKLQKKVNTQFQASRRRFIQRIKYQVIFVNVFCIPCDLLNVRTLNEKIMNIKATSVVLYLGLKTSELHIALEFSF